MSGDLESRIARLEAIKEIEDLKILYADICDRGYDPAEIKALLTDDAVWDGGSQLGRHEGRDAIGDFFAGAPNRITWALHYMIAPKVEVSPNLTDAAGSWYLWQPCTIQTADGARAVLITGRYRNRFRKEDGRWLFSEITIDVQTETPLDEGWVKARYL